MKKYSLLLVGALTADLISALTGRLAFNSGSAFFLAISMISLGFIGYFMIRLMQIKVGIIVNVTLIALGAINITVFSYVFFDEKITWLQGLGMAVIVSGMILTEVYAPQEESGSKQQDARLAQAIDIAPQAQASLQASLEVKNISVKQTKKNVIESTSNRASS